MAFTVTIEGLGELDNAEATTNWGITGSGGSSISLDNEIYFQGSGSIASQISSGKFGWVYYNHGSGLNFTTTYSGQYILIWFQITTIGSSDALNTAAISFRAGSSTTVYREWALGGSDYFANGYAGGWQCAIIDPRTSGTSDVGGFTSPTSIQYWGIHYSGNTASRGVNVFCDSTMVGSGIRIIGTETTSGAGWQEVVDYCTDYGNRAWGFIQEKEPGIFTVYGKLYVGGAVDGDGTANNQTTTLTDSGRVFKFGDYEYYNNTATPTTASAIGTGFHGLVIEDTASYTTTFQDGILVGTDSGRSGSVFIGADEANTTFDLYGGNNASSTTKLYNTTMNGIDGGITWGNDADHEFFAGTITKSGQFDPVGAVEIRNCIFSETSNVDGCIVWNSNIDIESCTFIANTTGAAIEHPDWNGSESGTVTTADATGTTLIDSAATFTGNVAVNDIVYNETDGSYGTVTSIDSNTQITHSTLVGGTDNDWDSSDSYSITTPYTYTDLVFSGNTYDIDNTTIVGGGGDASVVAITKSGTSDPSTYPSGDFVVIQSSVTITITVKDVGGTVIQNAQVGVFATDDGSQLVNEDTNASGIATETYTGTTPREVKVWIRKASSGATKYKNYSSVQSVSTSGLTLSVTLVEDTNNNATS